MKLEGPSSQVMACYYSVGMLINNATGLPFVMEVYSKREKILKVDLITSLIMVYLVSKLYLP